jgi:general secretion pathway protein G
VDIGYYPPGTNGLLELVQQSNGATNWQGPYLEKFPVDPWGNRYTYECPGWHNTNAYDLFSAGPDGRLGTADDIGNWTK